MEKSALLMPSFLSRRCFCAGNDKKEERKTPRETKKGDVCMYVHVCFRSQSFYHPLSLPSLFFARNGEAGPISAPVEDNERSAADRKNKDDYNSVLLVPYVAC